MRSGGAERDHDRVCTLQTHNGPSNVRSAHLQIAIVDYCLSRVFMTVMSLSVWLSTE
jgi:hypothetical protein